MRVFFFALILLCTAIKGATQYILIPELEEIMEEFQVWNKKDFFKVYFKNTDFENSNYKRNVAKFFSAIKNIEGYREIVNKTLTAKESAVYNIINIEIRDTIFSYNISPINSYYHNNVPTIVYDSYFLVDFLNQMIAYDLSTTMSFDRHRLVPQFNQIKVIDPYANAFVESMIDMEQLDSYLKNNGIRRRLVALMMCTTFTEYHELYHLVYEKEGVSKTANSESDADLFALEKMIEFNKLFLSQNKNLESNPFTMALIDQIDDLSIQYLITLNDLYQYLIDMGTNLPSKFARTMEDLMKRRTLYLEFMRSKRDCKIHPIDCQMFSAQIQQNNMMTEFFKSLDAKMKRVIKKYTISSGLNKETVAVIKPESAILLSNYFLEEKNFDFVREILVAAIPNTNLEDPVGRYQAEYFNFLLAQLQLRHYRDTNKAIEYIKAARKWNGNIFPLDYYNTFLKRIGGL